MSQCIRRPVKNHTMAGKNHHRNSAFALHFSMGVA